MNEGAEVRYAFISDVHSNLPALDEVLSDIAHRNLHHVYHLGDLVGYGPWPNEVVERIREEGITGVAGNYDTTVGLGWDHCGCQYDDPRQQALSLDSFRWTLEHTSPDAKAFLGSLPFRLDLRPRGGHTAGPTFILIHGSANLNTVYWREDRSDDFCRKMIKSLGAGPNDIILFGHTHKPWSREVDGRLLVNTGSVGRPKDRDPRACYAIVTLLGEERSVEFVRIPYSVDEAAQATVEAGLPPEFGVILKTGGVLE